MEELEITIKITLTPEDMSQEELISMNKKKADISEEMKKHVRAWYMFDIDKIQLE